MDIVHFIWNCLKSVMTSWATGDFWRKFDIIFQKKTFLFYFKSIFVVVCAISIRSYATLHIYWIIEYIEAMNLLKFQWINNNIHLFRWVYHSITSHLNKFFSYFACSHLKHIEFWVCCGNQMHMNLWRIQFMFKTKWTRILLRKGKK